MKRLFEISLILMLLTCTRVNAQVNISGVINDYSKVTAIDFPTCQVCDTTLACMNNIQVQNPGYFSEGDKVLIIQMKGAAVDLTNDAGGGQITAIGNAGNYEFFDVKRVIGNSIYPKRQLTRTYDVPGLVQLVRVPTFAGNVNVNGKLTALPWDPATGIGGVLALFVEGNLTMNADMDVAGMGYIGETVSVNGSPDHCGINPMTQMNKPSTDNDVSPKGNGITIDNPLFNGGRAPRANGGGGGVSGDSGGGGGSNYGGGGNGGDRWCSQAARAGGIGGYALVPYLNLNKVFLGGAGGPGFVTSGNSADASNGGGIIVVKAQTIIGNGHTIDASGTSAVAPGAGIDGGGGGGAGGSVALATTTVTGNLNISLAGGDGQKLGTPVLHGPGGGGGGGALLHTLPTFPVNVNVDITGGIAGTHGGANSWNTNNATPGEDGGVVYVENVIREFNKGDLDVSNPVCTSCNGTVNIRDFSATSALTYSIDGGNSYSGSSLFLNLCKDTFEIQVVDEDGCVFDTIIYNDIDTNTFEINVGSDTAVCDGIIVEFGQDLGPGYTYDWNVGLLSAFVVTDSSGIYSVDVTDSNGCVAGDTVVLFVESQPDLTLQPDTVICNGDSIEFFASINNVNYEWSTGSTDSLITVGDEGEYWLEVTSQLGCFDSDTALLRVVLPTVDLPNDTAICSENDPLIITSIPNNHTTLNWSSGEVSQSINVNASGEYSIEVSDGYGCFDRDTINILIEENPVFDLGNDTNLCVGDEITIGINNTEGWSLNWYDGGISNNRQVSSNAILELTAATNIGCLGKDTIEVAFHKPDVELLNDVVTCEVDFPIQLFPTSKNFTQITWNNNETTDTIEINLAGIYSVVVQDDFGCVATDTVEVATTIPTVVLPADTILCSSGFPFLINGSVQDYQSLSWNVAGSSEDLSVNLNGVYILTAEDENGCVDSDTIEVLQGDNPVFNIGNDTAICEGGSAKFGIENPEGWNLVWNTGETTNNVNVSDSIMVSLEATTSIGCKSSDSALVSISKPQVNLPADTTICEGSGSVLILPDTNNVQSFIWSNGVTSLTQNIDTEGKYLLQVIDPFGCEATDSLNLITSALPIVSLPNDTSICIGESVSITATTNDSNSILWSTAETLNEIMVDQAGGFIAEVTSPFGCKGYDTVEVRIFNYPIVNLTEDTIVCFDDGRVNLTTYADSTTYSFLWNEGTSNSSVLVESEGVYEVTVSNFIGCSVLKEVDVVEYCPWTLYVPNSFTPNEDGYNDGFSAKGSNIVEFEMFIYNRWGQLIWKSNNINEEWDGTLNGNDVQIDTYVYKIYYSFEELSGIQKDQKVGVVNLIR